MSAETCFTVALGFATVAVFGEAVLSSLRMARERKIARERHDRAKELAAGYRRGAVIMEQSPPVPEPVKMPDVIERCCAEADIQSCKELVRYPWCSIGEARYWHSVQCSACGTQSGKLSRWMRATTRANAFVQWNRHVSSLIWNKAVQATWDAEQAAMIAARLRPVDESEVE